LPTDTSFAKPRPRAAPRDRSVPSIVPLCETMLVFPPGSFSMSSTAFTLSASRAGTLITPMLFGPSSRTPSSRARSTSRRCRFSPSGPASAKPPLKMLATATPRLPQSSSACSTWLVTM
jgi:hypothetical protein